MTFIAALPVKFNRSEFETACCASGLVCCRHRANVVELSDSNMK